MIDILCIICQEDRGPTHFVRFDSTGKRMFDVAKVLSDKQFIIRMNSISCASDAVANDVRYHLTCWVKAQREAKADPKEIQDLNNYACIAANIEITNLVEHVINHTPKQTINMNEVNSTYRQFLVKNSYPEEELSTDYKKYLKALIKQKVSSASFTKSNHVWEPEIICSMSTIVESLDKREENMADVIKMMFKVAKTIRKDVLDQQKWSFTGSVKNYEDPQLLSLIVKWITCGSNAEVRSDKRSSETNQAISIASQFIVSSTITQRQIMYLQKMNMEYILPLKPH